MKLLVFSDSHSDVENMVRITQEEQPDRILHLGDMVSDAQALAARFPSIPLHGVPGNNDYGESGAKEQMLSLAGKKLFLSHGHQYGVKAGISRLQAQGVSRGADFVLFGHTHTPYLDCVNGMWLVNPGSVCRMRYYSLQVSYGVILLDAEQTRCDIITQAR